MQKTLFRSAYGKPGERARKSRKKKALTEKPKRYARRNQTSPCTLEGAPQGEGVQIAASALVVAFAMPAFAANKFYLVQDTATKKCSIVEAKSTIGTMSVVGAVHKTKGKAEIAMKADKSCVTL